MFDPQMVLSSQEEGAMQDNKEDEIDDVSGDPEEHKETEQMPLTKDLMLSVIGRQAILDTNNNGDPTQQDDSVDELLMMKGADVEVSDNEKHVAQRSIRRSVVSKEKLNWSCQFAKGSLSGLASAKPQINGI